MRKKYNWKRFWIPRDGFLPLLDEGFLYNVSSEYDKVLAPDIVSSVQIQSYQVIVMLGEPGIGKSSAMEEEYESICLKIKSTEDKILRVDLGICSSDQSLYREIFDNKIFIDWKNGSHNLYLYLDSLDECRLKIDTVTQIIIKELSNSPLDRLRLRIACRTADLPELLEQSLQQMFPEGIVKILELTPLRRVDVLEAAKIYEGIDPKAFVKEVLDKDVVSFAIKPITLNILLDIFSTNKKLPSNQSEIFKDGCMKLCEESNLSRKASNKTGKLTTKRRFITAARIAALMFLSNKNIVSKDTTGILPNEIRMNEFIGKEDIDNEHFEVDEDNVSEVLSTGLFSSRGTTLKMGWAHQSYPEFLAAWYLNQKKLPLDKVLSLISEKQGGKRKIIPQLLGIVAWLSIMIPELFNFVLKIEPEVLLRSDLSQIGNTGKEQLVIALLQKAEKQKLSWYEWRNYRNINKLFHPKLANQLRPYLQDKKKIGLAREMAIDISRSSLVKNNNDILTAIALDKSEHIHLRANAALTISEIGTAKEKMAMEPLALEKAGNDPEDELKGIGLRAVWPSNLSTKDLFQILTPPKDDSVFGMYQNFITQTLAETLPRKDFSVALKWVASKDQPSHSYPYPYQTLMNQLIIKSWDLITDKSILELFAQVIFNRLKHADGIIGKEGLFDKKQTEEFYKKYKSDHVNRRLFIEKIISLLSNPEKDWVYLVPSRGEVIFPEDVLWLLEGMEKEPSEPLQRLYAKLISSNMDWKNPKLCNLIIEKSEKVKILAEEFKWSLGNVDLGTPEAEGMKKEYLQYFGWEEKKKKKSVSFQKLESKIEDLLTNIEKGNIDSWVELSNLLFTDNPEEPIHPNFEPDLTQSPYWENLQQKNKLRITNAAKKYLQEKDFKVDDWILTNQVVIAAFAGYRAIYLLFKNDFDFINKSTDDNWKKWVSLIIGTSRWSEDRNLKENHINDILTLASKKSTDEFTKYVLLKVDQENDNHNMLFIADDIKHCLDEKLIDALVKKLNDPKLKPVPLSSLLAILLERGIVQAIEFAKNELKTIPDLSHQEERTRKLNIAASLMLHAPSVGWSIVWPIMQKDIDFSKELLEQNIISFKVDEGVVKKLNEDQIAELYMFVETNYPSEKDSPRQKSGSVGPKEIIEMWRGSLPGYLLSLETNEALNAFIKIRDKMPELPWVNGNIDVLEDKLFQKNWNAPTPLDILSIIQNSDKIVVNDEEQLQKAVLESLSKIQKSMHDELGYAEELWEKNEPRNETFISRYIARRLQNDLVDKDVIINCEVEIRPTVVKGTGQRTDIHICAVPHDTDITAKKVLKVIIENKGCWNTDLETAMEDQLVDKYMKDNSSRHGIYLISWFDSPLWDSKKDSRKNQKEKLTPNLKKTREKYEEKAQNLSKDGLEIATFVLDASLRGKQTNK